MKKNDYRASSGLKEFSCRLGTNVFSEKTVPSYSDEIGSLFSRR